MNVRSFLCLAAAATFLSGCAATQTYAPEQAPEMAVVRDFTQFYRLGPSQGGGPDATLRVDARVKLLRKEMGYSLVQLEDGRTGYVANEDFAPAPPKPKPTPEPAESRSSSRSRNKPDSPRYQGDQVNDTPLPESPLSLDLNIGPEDVVPPAPTPQPTPTEPPKFRY